jgi:pimeloyl-ACP methyl ester carboxylesterase
MYLDSVNVTPLATFQSLLRDYTQFEGRKLLPQIACPTLIIAGEDDCITPIEVQEEIAQLIPNSELQKISEGSHNAHLDRPQEVNEKIENFLSRTAYR